MGNAQRLPNGNTLINWVYDKIVEVDSNGAKQFEMNLVGFNTLYRVYRFPWEGVVKVPYLIIEPYLENTTFLFNKFGDTNVAYYRIYGGTTPQPTNLLATSSTTLKRLTNLENGRLYYFRVTAVDKGAWRAVILTRKRSRSISSSPARTWRRMEISRSARIRGH